MDCFICGGDTKVIDSRWRDGNIKYRRRECLDCGERFTTYESVEKVSKFKYLGKQKKHRNGYWTAVSCGACGWLVHDGQNYCDNCGIKLKGIE